MQMAHSQLPRRYHISSSDNNQDVPGSRYVCSALYPNTVQMQCNHSVLARLITNALLQQMDLKSAAFCLPKWKLAPVSVHLLYFLFLWFNINS